MWEPPWDPPRFGGDSGIGVWALKASLRAVNNRIGVGKLKQLAMQAVTKMDKALRPIPSCQNCPRTATGWHLSPSRQMLPYCRTCGHEMDLYWAQHGVHTAANAEAQAAL